MFIFLKLDPLLVLCLEFHYTSCLCKVGFNFNGVYSESPWRSKWSPITSSPSTSDGRQSDSQLEGKLERNLRICFDTSKKQSEIKENIHFG